MFLKEWLKEQKTHTQKKIQVIIYSLSFFFLLKIKVILKNVGTPIDFYSIFFYGSQWGLLG